MASERPKIKVPFESIDIAVELASITLLLLVWLYIIMEYPLLPKIIASHFNASGQPDGYGNKVFILFLPALSTAMYIGLFILNKYPHLHNYMVNITEANALKNYRFSTRVLRVVNFLTVLMFAYISYHIVVSAKGEVLSLGKFFLPLVIGISVLLPIGILIYQKKINKS